ncbi:hypothetical protein VBD025_03965 [Virgibacillus flavescens]|uniref:hypothetical protein n=1 Tax=Virgibacillus flavescens TaxID=1611422 RepID=UPI003D33DDA6
MDYKFPQINELTTIEAINWDTQEVAEVFSTKSRIAGTYSEAYKDALLSYKQELNTKALTERKRLMKGMY